MRILFVCPWAPAPTRPRALGVLRHLVAEHEVWVVCTSDGEQDMSHLSSLPLAGITTIPLRPVEAVLRAAAAIPTSGSLQVAYVAGSAARRAVRERVRAWRPDVVHLNVARTAGFLPEVGSLPVVVDMDELRSDYYAQLAREAPSLRTRCVATTEARRLVRLEHRVSARAAAVLYSSPHDLGRIDGAPSRLVRSLVPTVPRPRQAEGSRTLLFVGRLSYSANVEALEWFAASVLPQLRSRRPHVSLEVVGTGAGARVHRLAGTGLRVVGAVEDLAPYYARAAVAVVPIIRGTGVQMKLLQALASGTPCVTTTDCAVRAGVGPESVAIADGAEQWVDVLDGLLADPEGAGSMAGRGKAWADEHNSDQSIGLALRSAYREAVGVSV